jgi:FkbM family methyltransferase
MEKLRLSSRLKKFYRYIFKNPPRVRKSVRVRIERHGSEYGGWNIVNNSLDRNSIVYSFGIGEDVSFDLSIIRKFGCEVFGFDPTARVQTWVDANVTEPRFRFYSIGLASKDGELVMYEPIDPSHISHTSVNLGNSKKVVAPCKNLRSCMNLLGHSHIDLVKIDIEGFEYEVVPQFLSDGIFPKQLLVEFHHFFPQFGNRITEDTIRKIEQLGYELFDISDSFCEYSFLRKS